MFVSFSLYTHKQRGPAKVMYSITLRSVFLLLQSNSTQLLWFYGGLDVAEQATGILLKAYSNLAHCTVLYMCVWAV